MPFIISIKANEGFSISPETAVISLLLVWWKRERGRFSFPASLLRDYINQGRQWLCNPVGFLVGALWPLATRLQGISDALNKNGSRFLLCGIRPLGNKTNGLTRAYPQVQEPNMNVVSCWSGREGFPRNNAANNEIIMRKKKIWTNNHVIAQCVW